MTQWIDEVEWNNLNPEEIVALLKQNKASLSEVSQVIDKLSVAGTNSNTTIFYSGLTDTEAFIEAQKQAGYRIIDTTKAGEIIGSDDFQDYLSRTFKNENLDSFLYDGRTDYGRGRPSVLPKRQRAKFGWNSARICAKRVFLLKQNFPL